MTQGVQAGGAATLATTALPMNGKAHATEALSNGMKTADGDALHSGSTWTAEETHLPYDQVLAKRRTVIGPNVTLNYDSPLHLVRGQGCYLYDADGNEYLDCANNVAHVGHCHPKVTAAIAKQLATLNTNVRYLHDGLCLYAEALTATLPDPLSVVYFVCSGSEANDLALRIVECAAPGAEHIAIMGGAYHGHTKSLIDLSPLKYNGPGGQGQQPHVHVLPCPDPYRGLHLDGRKSAKAAIAEAEAAGAKIGAFFCEPVLSCGGQIVLPEGYMREVYEEMHAHGALCIADEVQCGFGRLGDHFWAFEQQGVVPDIVALGKPIANGFPMGALVVQPQIAKAFANGMEFFATYGGCTAAGAAGMATLKVIKEEKFQERAQRVGRYLTAELKKLKEKHECIGDVRGTGLMVGVELVRSKASKAPAPATAKHIKEECMARRVLTAVEGPAANVIKLKPPMTFAEPDVDRLCAVLDGILSEGLPESVLAADAAWKPREPKRVQG